MGHRLCRKTAAGGFDWHRSILSLGKLGNFKETVSANVLEPKLGLKTERDGDGVHESIGYVDQSCLAVFRCATDSHRNLRPLVTRVSPSFLD